MADNSDLKVIVRLNVDQSVDGIKNDLRTLESKLASTDGGKLKLIGRLNTDATQKVIERQLQSLKIDGSKLKITPDIKLSMSGKNNGLDSISNSATQATQKVNDLKSALLNIDKTAADFRFKAGVNDEGEDLEKTLENARKLFSVYKDIKDVKFSWSTDESGEVNKINAIVTSLTGQVETLRFELQKTNGVYNDIFAFTGSSSGESGIVKSIKDAEKLSEKIRKVKADYESNLAGFQSKYGANITKGLNTEIETVKSALNNLGTNESITNLQVAFQNLEIKAKSITSHLRTMNDSFNVPTNAENTFVKWEQDITGFENSIKNLTVKNEDLEKKVKGVRSQYEALKTSLDSKGLTEEWSIEYEKVNRTVKEIRVSLEAIRKEEQNSLEANRNSQYQQQQRSLKSIIEAQKEIVRLSRQRLSADEAESEELARQIKNARQRVRDNSKTLVDKDLYAGVARQIADSTKAMNEQLNLVGAKRIDSIKRNYQDMSSAIDRAVEKLKTLQSQPLFRTEGDSGITKLSTDITTLIRDYEKLQKSMMKSTPNSQNLDHYAEKLVEIDQRTKAIRTTFDTVKGSIADATKAYSNIERSMSRLDTISSTKIFKDFSSSEEVKQLQDRISQLKKEYQDTFNTLKQSDVGSAQFKDALTNLDALDAKMKELVADTKGARDALNNAKGTTAFEKQVNSLTNSIKELQNVTSLTDNQRNALSGLLNRTGLAQDKATLEQISVELTRLRGEIKQTGTESKNFDQISKSVEKVITDLNAMGRTPIFTTHSNNAGVIEFQGEIKSLSDTAKQVKADLNALGDNKAIPPELKARVDNLTESFKKLEGSNKTLQANLRQNDGWARTERQIQTLTARIKEYMAVNTKAAKKYSGQFDGLLSGLSQAEINKDSEAVRKLSADFQILRSQIKAAGDQGKTLWQSFIDGAKRFTMWFSITANIARAIRSIRQMISTVRELNTAMTAVIRVTQGTDAAYKQFFENAIASAKELKMNLVDLISQSAEWAKRGYNLSEVPTLAKASGIYSVVADIDNATAVQHLTTVLKTYNLTADDAIEVTSKLDNIANRYAVTAGDLGEILAHSISAMQVSHNTLDQTIAMGTAIAQITGNANEAGSTLKVLSMRLRGAKTEIESASEDTDGMAESVSKLREKIMALTNVNGKGGFDIMVDADNFKSTYEIMEGISKVWKDISDVNQAALLEVIAGKMRGNTVATLLTHMADANDILTDSINSQGVALEEYQHYLNSIEGKWQGLSTSAQAFASAAIDDNTIKGLLDLGTGFLNVLTDIIKQFGTLQTLLPIVMGLLSGFKNVGIFTTMNDQLTGATGKLGIFGRTLSQINNDLSQGKFASLFHLVPKSEITALQSYGQALLSNSNKIKNWDKALAKGKINQQTYNQTIENTVGSLKGLSTTSQLLGIKIKQLHSDFLAGKMSASEFTMQVNTLIGAQKAATVATQVLGTALRTAFNIGIGIAIGAIISWIQDLITENQRMAEISKQAADEIKDELNSLEDYSEKIISLRKELESTNTTTERAADVRQELYDIQKDLIENYGAEKDSIDLVTGSIKDQIEELKNLGKQKYDSQYYSNYQATQTTLGNLNNLDLVLDDRAWRDYANQMWQNSNASRFRDDVQDYMKSVLESAGFKYEGGFYKLDGNAFDVNDALVSVEKQVEQAINNLDINDYPNPAAYADAEKQLRHVLEYLSAVNKDVTSPLIEHEEELAQYIKYNEKYSEQYWKLFTARANYEAAQERGIQEEIIAARKAFIDTYNALVIDEEDNAVSWWFEKEFREVTNESKKAADTTVKNLNPIKDKLNELNSVVSEFKETIDTAFSSQSTLQSAFDKIQEGASLSADEVRKLVEICPELAVEFTKTVDGYTISSDALIKANDNIIQSTKESVEAQIKGYQEVIDKYNEIKNVASMPESARQDRLKALGITEDDIKNAEQQINQYRLILGMLGITLEKNIEEVSKYNQIIKDNSSKVSLIASATKEMTDEGHISASTYAELVEKGGNFTECLEVQNGKLVLNIDKLKELEKQEYFNIIAENNLAIKKLETTERTSSNAKAVWEEIQAYKTENALLQQMANEIDDAGVEEPPKDTSDPIKEAFEKDMKDIEHLHNMGLASDEEYYDALEKANERHYKNSVDHESDYLSNIEKIYKARQSLYKDDADKQFDDLEDQYKRGIITAEQYAQGLHDLGQELYGEDSIYGGTEFAIKALEELDKKVKEASEDIYDEFKDGLSVDGDKTLFNVLSDAEELWNKTNELFAGDLTSIKSNAKDIFGAVSSALEDALKKGIITVDGYESLLRSWANTLQVTEADVTNALVDTYEYRVDALQKANDGSLASERKYIADMKSLNFSTYGDENSDFYDPTTYASNLRDITDHQLDVLEKALNNGEISVQEYANSVVEIFKDADILGADYVSEKLDDIDKVRAEREKTYWEQQKELMEDYYDKQIKEIEETQKAKEKENKLEELHLKLIKARQTLEEAKNNRNQLIFNNGTFEYVADQDAVMSAEEEVANTLKEIENEKLQEQIDLLEEQKDAALGFYDQILDEIDFYLNKTLPLSESDQEELAKIRNSDYAQYARDKRDGNLIVNSDNDKIAEDALNQTDTAEETKQSVSNIAKNVLDIGKLLANGFNFENLVRALGGNPTAEAVKNFQDSYNATLVGKQIEPSTVKGSVTNNNGNTTNSNQRVVFTGDINVNVALTLESLDDFVGEKIDAFGRKVAASIRQQIPRAVFEK